MNHSQAIKLYLTKGPRWGNKNTIQHIGRRQGERHAQEISFITPDGSCCSPYQSSNEGLPFARASLASLLRTNTKPRHWAQNPGPTKGNGIHSLPTSNLRGRVLSSDSLISSTNYLKFWRMRSHYLSQVSSLQGSSTFPPLWELLRGEGLKNLAKHPWLLLRSSCSRQKGKCWSWDCTTS